MAQSSILKSTSITNSDATPRVANEAGQGAPVNLRSVNDYITAISADDTGSRYRLLRIPTTAKLKRLSIFSKIASAGSGDINVAFSDGPDGPAALAGGIVQITGPADNKLFGAAQSLVLAGVDTDFTFKGTFLPAHQNLPLWQVLVNLGATQFSSNPGGFFDILIAITTAVTTGGVVAARAEWAD
jgi:hypothetical protein